MRKEKKTGFFGDLGDPNNPINIYERDNEVKIPDETKFCPNCGEKIDAKAEICPKCGVRVAPLLKDLKESPQGGARILLYIISLFIPIIGIIVGVIYLMKPSQDAHNFGVGCLIISILPIVLIILVLVLSAGIFSIHGLTDTRQSCEVSVADIRPGNMGLTSTDVMVVFEIRNLGDTKATLDKIDYKVYGNDTYIGSGEVTKKIEIPPYCVKTVLTSFMLKYADIGETVRSTAKEGTMKWEVEGTAYLHTPTGDINVPLKFAKNTGK